MDGMIIKVKKTVFPLFGFWCFHLCNLFQVSLRGRLSQ